MVIRWYHVRAPFPVTLALFVLLSCAGMLAQNQCNPCETDPCICDPCICDWSICDPCWDAPDYWACYCANLGLNPAQGGGCNGSPIVVNLHGGSFQLTDGPGGVSFDLNSDGLKEQVSWTAATSAVAFIVLDRNNNGVIDNGRELFGNYTLQSEVANRNGFAALAMYDKASFGGNGDGVITKDDTIYSRLQLWLDLNHNGISEPSELHSLAEYSIESLPLKYEDSRRVDEFGNLFRYRAKVEARDKHISRWAYDVFLRTPLSSANSQTTATRPEAQPPVTGGGDQYDQ